MPLPCRVAALLIAAALIATHAHAQKTLRVAFPIAENGFDPQAIYDEYSAKVCNVIFDTLYAYDYFARPVKLVPNTADGMPQITDRRPDVHDQGAARHLLRRDPAFGGKKRELTAHDYVYSIKRILDPKVRSYYLYLFENRLVGLDPVLAQARKTGKLDYDAPIEGLKALDKYTLQIRFKEPDYGVPFWLASTTTAAVAQGGGRRQGRCVRSGDGGSGGHRPVQAGGMASQPAHRARSQPGFSRRALSRPARRRARRRMSSSRKGWQAASSRWCRGRDLDRRGIAAAPARVPQQGSSTTSTCHASLATTVLDGAKLKPDLAAARRQAASPDRARRSASSSSTWTTRSSAATRRKRSRCAARS